MAIHSRVSASNERASKCGGSVVLGGMVEARNFYLNHKYAELMGEFGTIPQLENDTLLADTGTALHVIRDECLTGVISDVHDAIDDNVFDDEGLRELGESYIADSMAEDVDHLRREIKGADEVWFEHRVTNAGTGSTGILDLAWRKSHTLYVNDLKTGRIPISANCYQLKRLAAGLMDELGWSCGVKTIILSISGIQFKSTTHEMRAVVLREWAKTELMTSMDNAHDLNLHIQSGEWCKYCPARGVNCTASSDYAHSIIDSAENISAMSTVAIERLIVEAKTVESIIKNAKSELLIRDPDDMTLLTRVSGVARKYYTASSQEVIDKVQANIDPQTIINKPRKMMSKAGLSKILPPQVMEKYNRFDGVSQFEQYVEDMDELLRPAALKTQNQLMAIFKDVEGGEEAVSIAINDGDTSALLALAKENSVFVRPISPSAMMNIADVSDVIETRRGNDTFKIIPK